MVYSFCTSYNLKSLPTSEYTMMLFAAHLVISGLTHTSIKVTSLLLETGIQPVVSMMHMITPLHTALNKFFGV